MQFRKYQHILNILEAYEDAEDGIYSKGVIHIFPKLDGCNCQMFNKPDGTLGFGSRNLEITSPKDNYSFIGNHGKGSRIGDRVHQMLKDVFPESNVYGEFLMNGGTVKYADEYKNKFMIFDIVREDGSYVHYDEYSKVCKQYDLDYIEPLVEPVEAQYTKEDYLKIAESNHKFLQDPEKFGEGIVIKKYDYTKNDHGRTAWYKLVLDVFRHGKDKKVSENTPVPSDLVKLLLDHITIYEIEKILREIDSDDRIPSKAKKERLIGSLYKFLVQEAVYPVIRKHRGEVIINFSTLMKMIPGKVIELYPDFLKKG